MCALCNHPQGILATLATLAVLAAAAVGCPGRGTGTGGLTLSGKANGFFAFPRSMPLMVIAHMSLSPPARWMLQRRARWRVERRGTHQHATGKFRLAPVGLAAGATPTSRGNHAASNLCDVGHRVDNGTGQRPTASGRGAGGTHPRAGGRAVTVGLGRRYGAARLDGNQTILEVTTDPSHGSARRGTYRGWHHGTKARAFHHVEHALARGGGRWAKVRVEHAARRGQGGWTSVDGVDGQT